MIREPVGDVAAAELGNRRNYTNIDRGDDARRLREFPLAGLSENLKNIGYTFDHVFEKQLLNSKVSSGEIVTSVGTANEAVVVPGSRFMPMEALQQLIEFTEQGGKVLFDAHLQRNVPGIYRVEMREEQMEAMKLAIDYDKWVGNVIDLLANSTRGGSDQQYRN